MGVRRFDEHPLWQRARRFRQAIYRISADWPAEERYGLRAQIRDAAISITSNFAEGFGRYHFQENIQHCRIARGSINECLDHLYTALDERYITREVFDKLYTEGRELERDFNGYIGFLQREAAKWRNKRQIESQ